ncbi:MAG: hypothetical protein AAF152_18940 [Cyanobacteria bacterium P01_A01_bin.114]
MQTANIPLASNRGGVIHEAAEPDSSTAPHESALVSLNSGR